MGTRTFAQPMKLLFSSSSHFRRTNTGIPELLKNFDSLKKCCIYTRSVGSIARAEPQQLSKTMLSVDNIGLCLVRSLLS